ncbi:hypothetical protein OROMI_034631 [Orobanche minor]
MLFALYDLVELKISGDGSCQPRVKSNPGSATGTVSFEGGYDLLRDGIGGCSVTLLACQRTSSYRSFSSSFSPEIDVERHARDFMEAAKKLQLYLIRLQREEQPTRAETLRKEIAEMEEELKVKTELMNKQERLIQRWRTELKEQLDKHNIELERV